MTGTSFLIAYKMHCVLCYGYLVGPKEWSVSTFFAVPEPFM